MIPKIYINKILFIRKYLLEQDEFINEFFENLELYRDDKIKKTEFNSWLESWVATAELDSDPQALKRIERALEEIKSNKTPHKSWQEFKRSLGLNKENVE